MIIPLMIVGSIFGLFLYIVVGCGISFLFLRLFDGENFKRAKETPQGYMRDKSDIMGMAGLGRRENLWGNYTAGVIFWPVYLAFFAVVGLGYGVGIGPVKLVKGIGGYLAKASIPKEIKEIVK